MNPSHGVRLVKLEHKIHLLKIDLKKLVNVIDGLREIHEMQNGAIDGLKEQVGKHEASS